MKFGIFLWSVYSLLALYVSSSPLLVVDNDVDDESSGITVITLKEGSPIYDTVETGKYKYYSYTANSTLNDRDIIINVNPTSGDSDFYVNCALTATGDDDGNPSKSTGHYVYSSAKLGEDTIVISATDNKSCIKGVHKGCFYIAVYGYSYFSTQYTITAVHSGGVRKLLAGIPTESVVYKDTSELFKFKLGKETQKVMITLTITNGDADLYVKLGGGQAGVDNYDYKSDMFNNADDTIEIPESNTCVDCWVSILVYGWKTTQYSIVIKLEETTLILTDGVPQKGSVAKGLTQYYKMTTTNAGKSSTQLTVFTGEPVLYVSTTISNPNSDTYKSSPNEVSVSDSMSTGNIPVVNLNDIPANSDVYIGVSGGETNATYTLRSSIEVANTITLLRLLNGIPQTDSIPYDPLVSWKYYQIPVQAGHEALYIRLTQLHGEVDVYVTQCPSDGARDCQEFVPTTTNYIYTTEGFNSDIIYMERNDDKKCSYLVAVKSTSYSAAYELSVSLEDSVLELSPGITVTDHVLLNEYDYFSFQYYSTDSIIKITLQALNGDPDLYIAWSYIPNKSNFTWRAYNYGNDLVTINPATDINACTQCSYYIAVHGSKESDYTITASLDSTIPHLVDGQPYTDTASLISPSFYTFLNRYGDTRDFKLTLASTLGDANIYVTVTSDGGGLTDVPSIARWDYKSENTEGDDVIRIFHTDDIYTSNGCNDPNTGCVLRIGVYSSGMSNGFSSVQYTLLLTSSLTGSLLQMGVSQTGSISPGSKEYYKALLSGSNYILQIAPSIITGHIVIYMSCDVNIDELGMPSSANYMWKYNPEQENSASSTYDISVKSITDKGCYKSPNPTSASTAMMYFTVESATGNSASAQFSMMVRYKNDSNIPLLVPSTPYSGTVSYHAMDYYYLRPTLDYNNIRLMVTTLQGDVDIYISSNWEERPYYFPGHGVASYKFSSTKIGDDEVVLTHDNILDLCPDTREYCYFVVAIYGAYDNTNTPSSFRIQYSVQDSTILLSSGIPMFATVGNGRIEYFKYPLYTSNTDVIFSLSAMRGDPDVFIDLAPNRHPNRSNFTWASASYGSDFITIQAEDISKHCVPDQSKSLPCYFYAAVFGWSNSSFSIMVNTANNFSSPVVLLDGQPQNGYVAKGRYVYYKYYVSATNSNAEVPFPISLSFTLTPQDDSDADIYIKFASSSSTSDVVNEPGRDNYDYRSIGWSSVADSIDVSASMDHYCFDCIVYIAVYGYTDGYYTVSASSKGVTAIQNGVAVGGHVQGEGFKYYSYYNSDPFSIMTIMLTTITGDADLYVTKYEGDVRSGAGVFPTRYEFMWRSFHFGDDILKILYTDRNYCYNCEYIIGVYGYSNSTFSLMLSESEATVISLAMNRPQAMTITGSTIKYFSVALANSADDVTITLTSTSGSGDIFLKVYNTTDYTYSSSNSPNPSDPSSYTYTTKGSGKDYVTITGPFKFMSTIVIAVKQSSSASSYRFSILASSVGKPILLQTGLPQSHFVQEGTMEYFQYFISDNTIEDLQVAVTARSGDPDILIYQPSDAEYSNGHYPLPICKIDGVSEWVTSCRNYTWMSNMYSTDQIVINNDYPCDPVIATTRVSEQCNDEYSYRPGSNTPIIIGVFGFRTASFTILVTPSGQRVKLLPGQPQLSTTSLAYECSQRSSDNNACLTTSKVKRQVQTSYFMFTVTDVADVSITIQPQCNATSSNDCQPGCDCDPLVIYINSCIESKCKASDMYPSSIYGQYKEVAMVPSRGKTILISANTYKKAYCSTAGSGSAKYTCQYFISIGRSRLNGDSSRNNVEPITTTASFTVTARTDKDITLLPCDDRPSPDGIRPVLADTISSASTSLKARYYELCANDNYYTTVTAQDKIIFSVEQCSTSNNSVSAANTKSLNVYTCSAADGCNGLESIFPTSQAWTQYSDHKQSCSRAAASSKPSCTTNPDSYNNNPTVLLPQLTQDESNYFVMLAGDTGDYVIHVENTINGVQVSPLLIQPTSSINEGLDVTVVSNTNSGIKVSWYQSYVLIPGVSTPVFSSFVSYKVYVIDIKGLRSMLSTTILYTKCGIENILTKYPASIKEYIVESSGIKQEVDPVTYTISTYPSKSEIFVVVMASCDSDCLNQVSKDVSSKGIDSAKIFCGVGYGKQCAAQYKVYNSVILTTKASSTDSNSADSSSISNDTASGTISMTVFVILVAIIALSAYAVMWYRMRKQERDMGVEPMGFEMVENTLHKPDTSRASKFTIDSNDYSKLPMMVEDEDSVMNPMNNSLKYEPPSLDTFKSKFVAAATHAYSGISSITSNIGNKYMKTQNNDDGDEGIAL